MSNWNQEFGPETVIVRHPETKIEVRTPETSVGCEYVRVVMCDARAEDDVNGVVYEGECELAYWDQSEWEEDPTLMGVLLCAIRMVAEGEPFDVEFGYRAFE